MGGLGGCGRFWEDLRLLNYGRCALRGQLEQGGLWFANRVGLLTGALDWEYWEAVGDFGRI